MQFHRSLILLSLIGFLSSCSGTKWIVQPEPVIDYKSPSLKQKYVYPLLINTPTPRQPVLEFEIISVNESEYPRRLQSRRHVQQYGLRPGLIAVSLIGSSALLYVANSPNSKINTGLNNQNVILNISAGVVAATGFLALKPVGKPLPTDETRMMSQVGTILLRDSTSYRNETILSAFVSVSYKDSILVNRARREFVNGKLLLDMSREVQLFPVSLVDPGEFVIQIDVAGNTGSTKIPVSSVMSQFVRVRTSSTPLRSSPREVPSNILSNIITGSQLLYQETHDAEWIRVLYGAASTYLKRSDVDFIWRPIEKNNETLVITSREADFGSVDIERDIPVYRGSPDSNAIALIIGNSDYLSGISQKPNSVFNADIINRYVTSSFGISNEKRFNLQNPDRIELEEILSFQGRQTGLKNVLTDSSSLAIYITGKGYFDQELGSLFYLPSDTRPDLPTITGIELETIFNSIARLPYKQCTIYLDVDFSSNLESDQFIFQRTDQEPYEKAIRNFLIRPNTGVIFSNQLSQLSGEYKSTDGRLNNRYSIATYFFIKAIKEQRTSLGDIFQFMENNINFTSRLLHNRAQSPVFFGDPSLRLIR